MNNTMPYIERYFNGELLPAEISAFESLCLSDPAFAQMVAFYISLHDHLQEQWKEQKRQDFATLEEAEISEDADAFGRNGDLQSNLHDLNNGKKLLPANENSEQGMPDNLSNNGAIVFAETLQEKSFKKEAAKASNFKVMKRLAIAAAVTGLVVLSFTLFVQKNKEPDLATKNKKEGSSDNIPAPDTAYLPNVINDTTTNQAIKKNATPKRKPDQLDAQRLYAQNFLADAAPKETGGMLEDAVAYYKSGSYKEASHEFTDAIAILESLQTRTAEDEKSDQEKKRMLFYAHYYNALSYMAYGKTEKAISELKGIKESPDKFWHGKLQWYLALAYLKTGQPENAVALLNHLAGNKHAGQYRQKAIGLTNELKALSTN